MGSEDPKVVSLKDKLLGETTTTTSKDFADGVSVDEEELDLDEEKDPDYPMMSTLEIDVNN